MQPFDSRQADEVATLLALAEHGSFAAAGRALQRHPSVLSKRLGALERRLGIRLVERTTRQLRFTDEGERLASRFRQAVDLLDEAEHEASLGAAQLRGRLRIALPSAMGRLWLGPLLAEFALAHPQVVLETDYSERFVDIIAEGFDLAIGSANWPTAAWWPGGCAPTGASSAPLPTTWSGMGYRVSRPTWRHTIASASADCTRTRNGS